jgi:ribonuclease D
VSLDKKHTRANWLRRPLSLDELGYAMDDVRHLVAVYEELKQKLDSTRRSSWIEKDLRAMSDPENYQVDKSQLWRRLKGVLKLKDEKLQIASDLCRWREDLAQQQNRPRRWIAKDDALVEIARQKPEDFEALARIPELSEKTARRYGDELLKIIVQAERVDPTRWPQHDKSRSLSKQQLALGD